MTKKHLQLTILSAAACVSLSAVSAELGHMRWPENSTIAVETAHEAHVIIDRGVKADGGAGFSVRNGRPIEKVRGGVNAWIVTEQGREQAVLYPKAVEQGDAFADARSFNLSADGIVFFAFNKTVPVDPSQLQRVVQAAIARNAEVRVVGHADEVGSDRYNLRLSTRRAKAVADYLIGAGISPDQISFEGRGKREPADLNDPAKNRRAVISFAAAKGVKTQ
jgi:OOP family OmpA-OmpF porin